MHLLILCLILFNLFTPHDFGPKKKKSTNAQTNVKYTATALPHQLQRNYQKSKAWVFPSKVHHFFNI